MITKNMNVKITNEAGEYMMLCSSDDFNDKIVLKGDAGLYDIKELEQAISILKEFINNKEMK